MDTENKLNLKIIALQEVHYKRVKELDEEVANLRVALTETSQTLQELRQEFETYKGRFPEETDVQEEVQEPSSEK